MDRTSLGDRMKAYEKAYVSARAMPQLPVIARLDGRAFHSWCKDLNQPFDQDFMDIMKITTLRLVKDTAAVIGYTQSDEITLIFHSDNPESQIFFNGKLFKITSVLASMCTAYFNEIVHKKLRHAEGTLEWEWHKLSNKPLATFDCRVFQVPTKEEAVNCLIWREMDAVRNSILSVAQSKFSTKEMHGKKTNELQEMMFQKDGTNWGEDFTSSQKRGTYYQRVVSTGKITEEELKLLPSKHHAHTNPDLVVKRTHVGKIELPRLTQIVNRVEVIFDGAKPLIGGTNES
jgi:tRNA(His) 5'-end guanylyltransferase